MPLWTQYLIVLGVLLVCAPLLAWGARRIGSKVKGGLMLASALLGFGDVFDQPAKHAMEETRPVKGSPDNGEPPLP